MKIGYRWLVALAVLLITAIPAHAEKRVALVIGNNDYPALGADEQLLKAVNDAQAVGDTLEELGFEVSRTENASRAGMLASLISTADRIEPGDVAFFFFAGHGVSIDGANYLLPSDIPNAESGSESLVKLSAISEATIIQTLKARGARVAIVVLDACRNNPFSEGGTRAFGDASRGLSRPPTVETQGVFGLYSAGFGQRALDRLNDNDPNPNSVFTRVLVPALKKPGLSLIDVAYQVNGEVARLAGSVERKQEPAYYDQARGRDIYLVSAPEVNVTVQQTVVDDTQRVSKSASDPCASAQLHFEAARDLGRVDALEDHIQRFGSCEFAAIANMLIESLRESEPDVAVLTPSDGDGAGAGSGGGLSDSDAVAECQRLASDLASEADISAAIDACRVAAARVPTDDLTLYLLGEALNAAGDYSEAVDWYRKAADLGLADAQNALGLKYDAGEGVALDDQEAARLYRLAAEQGLAVAQYNLGLMYDFGEGVQENNAEAVRWYRKAAEQGRADAQNRMGLHYDAGEGVELDDREAVSWYRKAAEQGFAAAQHNLGLMYADGEGVGEDDVEAVVWLRRSAEQGYADAQNALGLKYDLGEGVALDDEEAARWYLRAAEQGLAAAQHNIGLMYDNGEGVPQDEAEAIRWYRLAAEQGHASAQNRLGLKYDSGSGVELDDVEAVKWFRAAADQGLAVAQYNIGLMYDYGEGVARDEAEAVYWLQLSSDQGYADATWTLGQKYLNGTGGLPTDTQRAAEHFLNALRNESGLAHEALVEDRASDLSIRARREVQRALRAEGAYSGLVDGIFDPETVAALERLYEGQ